MRWVSLLIVLIAAGTVQPQEDRKQVARLLDQAAKARPKEARILLRQVIRVVPEEMKRATQAETEALLARLARGIERSAQTMQEIKAVFGENNPKNVSRQIGFRRYWEQWSYEQPIRLSVFFDCIKGREARVQSVLVPPSDD